MSLLSGTPAPFFTAPTPANPQAAFESLGGRYILLVFLPPPSHERDTMLRALNSRQELMQDEHVVVFCVLGDEESFRAARQTQNCLRWFHDVRGEIRRLYHHENDGGRPKPGVVIIDPSMRIIGVEPANRVGEVLDRVAGFGPPDHHALVPLSAPILIVPRIFEPEFCRQLIRFYEEVGGELTGVMETRDGKTVGVFNDVKRRRDAWIPEGPLQERFRERLVRRLFPEIEKAFQFRTTQIERYIVACYDAAEGGFFRPHRDNTTPGTAHRKFAVSINLNSEFEGGDLRFPEFGNRIYRPPAGGAVVFSCSLLHEATPVTNGRRYATLPFLYDDEGARIRAENLHSLDTESA